MPCQHPGKVLQKQYLEPQNISQNALARAIKVPPRRINEIIHGKRGITADTAVRLATYFSNSASYWMHLQAEFEIEKVKHDIGRQLSNIRTPAHPSLIKTPESPTKPPIPKNIKRRLMR
jgi:addiction module HigA family antidote